MHAGDLTASAQWPLLLKHLAGSVQPPQKHGLPGGSGQPAGGGRPAPCQDWSQNSSLSTASSLVLLSGSQPLPDAPQGQPSAGAQGQPVAAHLSTLQPSWPAYKASCSGLLAPSLHATSSHRCTAVEQRLPLLRPAPSQPSTGSQEGEEPAGPAEDIVSSAGQQELVLRVRPGSARSRDWPAGWQAELVPAAAAGSQGQSGAGLLPGAGSCAASSGGGLGQCPQPPGSLGLQASHMAAATQPGAAALGQLVQAPVGVPSMWMAGSAAGPGARFAIKPGAPATLTAAAGVEAAQLPRVPSAAVANGGSQCRLPPTSGPAAQPIAMNLRRSGGPVVQQRQPWRVTAVADWASMTGSPNRGLIARDLGLQLHPLGHGANQRSRTGALPPFKRHTTDVAAPGRRRTADTAPGAMSPAAATRRRASADASPVGRPAGEARNGQHTLRNALTPSVGGFAAARRRATERGGVAPGCAAARPAGGLPGEHGVSDASPQRPAAAAAAPLPRQRHCQATGTPPAESQAAVPQGLSTLAKVGSPVTTPAAAEKVVATPAAAEQGVPPAGPLCDGGSVPAGSSVVQGGSPRLPSVQELSALLAAKLLRQVKEGSTRQLVELFVVMVTQALTPGEATVLFVQMSKQAPDNAGLCMLW